MSGGLFLLMAGGLAALLFGGELLVRGASRLAAALGISPIVIGLTVVAFGTSSPELAVSLRAALGGSADIAIANVVGSNNFNLLFILGASALVSPLLIHSQVIRREMPLMMGAAIAFFVMGMGGAVRRFEAAILFAGIVAYTAWLVREARRERRKQSQIAAESEKQYGASTAQSGSVAKSVLLAVVGLVVIMFGADWLVEGAVRLARVFGVSETVIGLTIVAAGTSLPEVVASIMATIKGERDIAVGNVVGSNIYNILAIVGLSGLFSPAPLAVSPALLTFDFPVMIGATALCWFFFGTGRTLSRLEGGAFIGIYVLYTTVLILKAQGRLG